MENNRQPIIYFYDSKKNILFKTRTEVLGEFNMTNNVWTWAWTIPLITNKMSHIIKNIFIYGTNIKLVSGKYIDWLIKKMLITSSAPISSIVDIEIRCAIVSYLSKKPFIIEFKSMKYMDKFIDMIHEFRGKFDKNNSNDISTYMFILDDPIEDTKND